MSSIQTEILELESQSNKIIHPDEQIRLLLVDDEKAILNSLRRLFRKAPHVVQVAESGQQALKILSNTDIDVIISDMRMPEMSGEEFLQQVDSLYPDIKSIVLSGYAEPENILKVINEAHIYSYVQKPWDELDLQLKVKNAAEELYLQRTTKSQNIDLLKQNDIIASMNESLEHKVKERTEQLSIAHDSLKEAYAEIEQSYSGIVKMLSYYSSLSIPVLGNHAESVAKIACQFARYIHLDDSAVKEVETVALLHDIGLTVISNEVLEKPYVERTAKEKQLIKQHAELGEKTLLGIPAMHGVAKIIRHHHEQFDGQGYPDKLKGKDIPLGARIMLLANDYDDMVSGHDMERPMSKSEALSIIRKFESKRYDPELTSDFCDMISEGGIESKFKNGVIKVLRSDELEPGMLLSENLINKNNLLLLTAGHKITPQCIIALRRQEKIDEQRYTIYIDVDSGNKAD